LRPIQESPSPSIYICMASTGEVIFCQPVRTKGAAAYCVRWSCADSAISAALSVREEAVVIQPERQAMDKRETRVMGSMRMVLMYQKMGGVYRRICTRLPSCGNKRILEKEFIY